VNEENDCTCSFMPDNRWSVCEACDTGACESCDEAAPVVFFRGEYPLCEKCVPKGLEK
jgi:hypothetical protein